MKSIKLKCSFIHEAHRMHVVMPMKTEFKNFEFNNGT